MRTSQVLLSDVSLQPAQTRPPCLVQWASDGPAHTWVLDRDSSNVIGRDNRYSTVIVDDAKVSCRHADIRLEHGRFVLYDLQSTTGTRVNGHRIQRRRLQPFDRIRLGKTTLIFVPGRRMRVPQNGHGPASWLSASVDAAIAAPALGAPAGSAAQPWCILGSSTRDVYIRVDEVASANYTVTFRVGDSSYTIPIVKESVTWGAKCSAKMDLTPYAHLGKIKAGGGILHSTVQVDEIVNRSSLPIQVTPIDDRQCWKECQDGYHQLGLDGIYAGQVDAPTNLILTNGTGDRIVLKSPVVEPHSTEAQFRGQVQSAVGLAQALLINSPKDRGLAQLVSDVAQAAGVVQYSVLSLSLPMADQISLLLARDTASVCNLAEFHQIASALGYACPSDEASADLMAVAFVMAQVVHAHAAGDLVVTLGARGCLAADQAAGAIAYIGLRPVRSIEVQRFVRMDTERRNGTGDRYFGSFALAHVSAGACGSLLRAWGSALLASVDMVRYLAPKSQPDASWFVIRPLPVWF